MKTDIRRPLALLSFTSLIILFVAYRSGYFDGSEGPSGYKSIITDEMMDTVSFVEEMQASIFSNTLANSGVLPEAGADEDRKKQMIYSSKSLIIADDAVISKERSTAAFPKLRKLKERRVR